MYSTCTFCYGSLGTNRVLETFGVARRVAFDPRKGCLWAVCPECRRWNLAPLEERWETVDECERRFRHTTLRYSSGNIGLAWLKGDMELIRVGPALRPEVAAWRYGRMLTSPRPFVRRTMERAAAALVAATRSVISPAGFSSRDPRAAVAGLFLGLYGGRVLDVVHLPNSEVEHQNDAAVAVVRFRHLARASLVRPAPGRPWALSIPHDQGILTVEGNEGVRTVARLLAIINGTESGSGGGFSHEMLELAVSKVDESAEPDSYFNRVLAIALRSDWGRGQEEGDGSSLVKLASLEMANTHVERLALRLTGRTFWSRGGIGSEPNTSLLDVPLVDRLALEMAAHEESERRALEGELEELEAAWREADEIATIADALLPI